MGICYSWLEGLRTLLEACLITAALRSMILPQQIADHWSLTYSTLELRRQRSHWDHLQRPLCIQVMEHQVLPDNYLACNFSPTNKIRPHIDKYLKRAVHTRRLPMLFTALSIKISPLPWSCRYTNPADLLLHTTNPWHHVSLRS